MILLMMMISIIDIMHSPLCRPTTVSTFFMSQVNIGPRLNATLSQPTPPNNIIHTHEQEESE